MNKTGKTLRKCFEGYVELRPLKLPPEFVAYNVFLIDEFYAFENLLIEVRPDYIYYEGIGDGTGNLSVFLVIVYNGTFYGYRMDHIHEESFLDYKEEINIEEEGK